MVWEARAVTEAAREAASREAVRAKANKAVGAEVVVVTEVTVAQGVGKAANEVRRIPTTEG